MTFTELEIVLMLGLVAMLIVNHLQSKLLNTHREAHAIIMSCINGVADKKAVFIRAADRTISCKPTNSLEKHNEVRV